MADNNSFELARVDTGKAKTLNFDGHSFTLPGRLPGSFAVHMSRLQRGDESAYDAALVSVFGDQLDDLLALDPSQEDIDAVLGEALPALYGLDVGEPSASSVSSKSNGKRSRPTSRATTKSTSASSGQGS